MKNIFRFLPLLVAGALPHLSMGQAFQEGFENYPGLFTGANPWVVANRSDSVAGGQPWSPGGPEIFPAQSGTGYVEANFLSTGGIAGTETISNWFLSPTINLNTGGTVSFYTRSAGGAPDRLEVRLSTSGSSTDVGATSATTGVFTAILLTINPAQLAAGMPAAYPTTWTQFTVVVPAVPGATGRLAFRYNVTNSGIMGTNGDYVGLDNLTSTNITVVPEPSTNLFLCVSALAVGGWLISQRRRTVQSK